MKDLSLISDKIWQTIILLGYRKANDPCIPTTRSVYVSNQQTYLKMMERYCFGTQRTIQSFALLACIGCFSCVDHDISYSPCTKFEIQGTYAYPIPFQSEAWFELRTLEDRINACRIPQGVLDTISTEALLETLLNYPLFLDYTAFDIMQNGFERIKGEQKGFAVFFERKDAFEVALDRYNLMGVRCDGTYPPFLKNVETPAAVALANVEMILFQDEFLQNLSEYETRLLFKAVFDKLELKYNYDEDYKETGRWTACAILGKIMFNNAFGPFKQFCTEQPFVEFFIQRMPYYRPENLDITNEIFRYAKQYIAAQG